MYLSIYLSIHIYIIYIYNTYIINIYNIYIYTVYLCGTKRHLAWLGLKLETVLKITIAY